MSRASPFPTSSSRRPRTPADSNSYGEDSNSYSSSTRPLQISRSSRAETIASPNGPSRPQRSELRSRQVSEYSNSDQASGSRQTWDRDQVADRVSVSTTRSDASTGNTYRPRANSSGQAPTVNTKAKRSQTQDSQKTVVSPGGMAAIMAFQNAGRKRAQTNGSDDFEYTKEKREARERERLTQERIKEKAPGRRLNGKAKAGDIDAILEEIKDEWDFVIEADFNHVDLALQLLDDSSLGKDMESFIRTKRMLSKALKGSVDKHAKAFNNSVAHHASLLNHLGVAQTQISDARASLLESKESLSSKRADLVQLWSRGQILDDMMTILDQIEYLKAVPDVLETLMSEKRLLQAAVLLIRSLKMINKPEMVEIGAVADLRSYLVGQETALREILIDELHAHLYLQSFWCESRWAVYTPNQQTFSRVEFEDEPIYSDQSEISPQSPTSPMPNSPNNSRLNRFLHDLTTRSNDLPHELDDQVFHNSNSNGQLSAPGLSSTLSFASFASMPKTAQNPRNPESDSFAYIETLLESLAVLGKLGIALDIVAQRLPSEIFALVETTLDEASERAEYGRRGSVILPGGARSEGPCLFVNGGESGHGIGASSIGSVVAPQGGLLGASSLRLAALESSAKQVDHETLKDFFWTVYSKLDAVSQGLRVVYEVSNRIGSRRDFKDSSGAKPGSLFPLAEVWIPVQAEVRTLLYDYLTDEEQGAASGRNPISSINEILRDGKFAKDRTRPVFRFADTDAKFTAKALRTHEDELNRVLKDTMPGLAQGVSETAVQATLSTVGTDDRLAGVGQHHRLIIKPDAFHVSILFQPTLAFLDRISEVLPSGIESVQSSSVVLDDFVLKVYLPQLEEKVSSLFHQAVTGPQAFQADPSSSRLSSEPLVKSSTQLMALINSLCAMLRSTPFHQENYSRLILGVIIQFYQRCSDRFQDLVSLAAQGNGELDSRVALAAQWAQRFEMSPCLNQLSATLDKDVAQQQQMCRQETHLEVQLLGQGTITRSDILPSPRSHSALGSLYRSVTWFTTELAALKSSPEEILSPTSPSNLESNLESLAGATSYTPYLPVMAPSLPTEQLKLPLTKEMALRFQALLKTYDQLAEAILHTIRIDIRCRTIHYLDSAMRHGNYHIDHEAGEPDPHVLDLNAELGQCDEFISTTLPKKEQQFVFVGLGHLMEHLLISNARHLRLVNHFGIKKVLRNILALQQSVKTLTNEERNTDFQRAKEYYALFFMSPAEMLDGIRKKQSFSFDEYKTMLDLQCGATQNPEGSSAPKASDRNYSMYVIDLHGLELDSSGDA